MSKTVRHGIALVLASMLFLVSASFMAIPAEAAKKPTASTIQGIAHMAYNVTSLAKARAFWVDYLGYAEPFAVSSQVAVIKINDNQYIELYEGKLDSTNGQYQLKNIGYYTTDAAALLAQLKKNGVKVPTSVTTNALGNLSFTVTDPDGHVIEFVQYMSTSLTGKTQGKAMPSTRIFTSIISNGATSKNQLVTNEFLQTKIGFLPNGDSGLNSHLIRIPNSDQFYECGVLGPNETLNAATAGKKNQVDLKTDPGMTIQEAVDILKKRDPKITVDLHYTSGDRWVGNIYDPDGSRVELDDK
ncbi:VOC family protein [Paenibacillus radicis (ex Xue et al. 2023)]|uniref:VOC family protein n=1 Tax=Paenibacillus radicis (ex Xue et al. 2023) TaxID=2972489 RepID=A0ABT1YCM2_9BACL|nr:VOC family protein [Paenibacillus radicis (ex Xue et al. 2023)]MCR8630955.1 VOC family protein [Paenibacillus radicis (ex Xue et al. 2023)]